MVDGRYACLSILFMVLTVSYASSAGVTWLVCSAWEFTETRVTTLWWVILTEYFSSDICFAMSGPSAYMTV